MVDAELYPVMEDLSLNASRAAHGRTRTTCASNHRRSALANRVGTSSRFRSGAMRVAPLVASTPRSQRAPHGHDLSKMIGVVVVDEEQRAEVALVALPSRNQRV